MRDFVTFLFCQKITLCIFKTNYFSTTQISKLIANLKTVSSRLIRKEFPCLSQKYFDNKPYFWTGAYFIASCGGVTVEQLKRYVENQKKVE